MSQKSSSSPYDYDIDRPHPSDGPAANEQSQVYGDPTIRTPDEAYGDPTIRTPDEVCGDPTIPTTPRTPGMLSDGDSTIVKSGPPERLSYEPGISQPDTTPAGPDVPYPAPDPYNPYPLPPGAYYEPYANAYAPPPPDPTLSATNPYDAYGPTIRGEYPPLPEAPKLPARPLINLIRNKRSGKPFLAALMALLLIGASALLIGMHYSNQATISSEAQQTAVAATYPFSNTLVLRDTLAGGNNEATYGWDDDTQNCFFANNAYHDAYRLPGFYKPCFATSTNFNNFTFQAQMVIKQGDQRVGGGLVFRADKAAYRFYRLFITTQGHYQLFSVVDRQASHSRILQDGVAPSFLTGFGQTNKIAVSVNRDHLAVYANRQLVVSVNDGTFSHGQIGFNVENPTGRNAEVVFTNAKVWSL